MKPLLSEKIEIIGLFINFRDQISSKRMML